MWQQTVLLSFCCYLCQTVDSNFVSSEVVTTVVREEETNIVEVKTTEVKEENKRRAVTIHQQECIQENGLDLHGLVMANTDTLAKETFQECLRFCLEKAPKHSHLLISYYNALLWGDQFNCMCADKAAFANSTRVPGHKCDVYCDQSNYRCGDAKSNLLSTYCLHQQECEQRPEQGICSTRLPHDIHGCVKHDFISWSHAHNVRNFSISDGNTDAACVWECRDRHPSSSYSLTRVVEHILTCSCGYSRAFEPTLMVSPDLCHILDEGGQDNDYYHINCVSDLDENGGQPDGGTRCSHVGPVGCIFQELLPTNSSKFTIMQSAAKSWNTTEEEEEDTGASVDVCLKGCKTMFPQTYFAGIHWNGLKKALDCWCLLPGAYNSSMLGPTVLCDQLCGPIGSGMFCGGPGMTNHTGRQKTVSIYCLTWPEFNNSSYQALGLTIRKSDDEIVGNNHTRPLLESIHNALEHEKVTTEVMVGLLTLLCIILTTIVVYLCYSRGISSLSRYVM